MVSKGARLPIARRAPEARKCNKCNVWTNLCVCNQWTARVPTVRAETVVVARFGMPGKLLKKRVLAETRKGWGE